MSARTGWPSVSYLRLDERASWIFAAAIRVARRTLNTNSRIQRRCSRFFYNLLTAPRTVSNTYAQVAPGAIVCKSRATHRALITCKCHVTGHLVRRDSSVIKFDRVEIAFIWALFYWLNHLTDEGGEETGVPAENPWRRASEKVRGGPSLRPTSMLLGRSAVSQHRKELCAQTLLHS